MFLTSLSIAASVLVITCSILTRSMLKARSACSSVKASTCRLNMSSRLAVMAQIRAAAPFERWGISFIRFRFTPTRPDTCKLPVGGKGERSRKPADRPDQRGKLFPESLRDIAAGARREEYRNSDAPGTARPQFFDRSRKIADHRFAVKEFIPIL